MKQSIYFKNKNLFEAFQTVSEQQAKKIILAFLRNVNGYFGSAKYPVLADRLALYNVALVDNPELIAAISFEKSTVYLNKSIFSKNDENKYDKQLIQNIVLLLRHELAHNMLMHEVRMMAELNKNNPNFYKKVSKSANLQNLLNILMDFEIANRVYTDTDQLLVRSMVINGKLCAGLVTAFDKPEWQNYSLEQMYHALKDEIKNISNLIKDEISSTHKSSIISSARAKARTNLGVGEAESLSYGETESPSLIAPTFDAFCKSDFFKNSFSKVYQDFLINNFNILDNAKLTKTEYRDILCQLAQTDFLEPFDVINPENGEVLITEVITTEDKCLLNEILKYLSGNINMAARKINHKSNDNNTTTIHIRKDTTKSDVYISTYNDLIDKLSSLEAADIQDLSVLLQAAVAEKIAREKA